MPAASAGHRAGLRADQARHAAAACAAHGDAGAPAPWSRCCCCIGPRARSSPGSRRLGARALIADVVGIEARQHPAAGQDLSGSAVVLTLPDWAAEPRPTTVLQAGVAARGEWEAGPGRRRSVIEDEAGTVHPSAGA